jgi:hypothetical protein
MRATESSKILSGLEFCLWQVTPYGRDAVFYCGSSTAMAAIANNLITLAEMVSLHGSGMRQIICKSPARAESGLPYGPNEKAPGSMSFADVERKYQVRFRWYSALEIRIGRGHVFELHEAMVRVGADLEQLTAALQTWREHRYLDLSFGHVGLRHSPDWLGLE